MLKRAKSFITGDRKKKNEPADLALPESAHLGRSDFIITTNSQCILTNNAVKRRNAPANSTVRRPTNDPPHQQNRYSLDITHYNYLLNDGTSSKESDLTGARRRGNSFNNKEKGEIVRGNLRKCVEIREEKDITAEVVPQRLGFFRRSKSMIIGSRKKREKDQVAQEEPDVFRYVSFRK